MRNRADNPYRTLDSRSHTLPPTGDWSARPTLRLAAICGIFLLAILIIAARLAYVETQLTEHSPGSSNREIERWEPIPSHDGRIIAADGEVLAEDQRSSSG